MSNPEPLRLSFDAFDLDERDARLIHDGRPVPLAPKAFAVLCALARQRGQLMTKNALLDAVWGHQHISESVLKTLISELRSVLSDDAKAPRYIETASRRGYRFIGNVRDVADSASNAPPAPLNAPIQVDYDDSRAQAIIGRRADVDRLRKAWGVALGGRRQIVWVAGEAGVGKTTLIEHFVAAAGSIRCAHGQCVEQTGAGEPYLPILEALGSLCRHDASLVSLLRTVAPTWLIQLPWLVTESERESLRRELGGASQDRMLRELGELLDRYTENQPLLLVTEDLHWSDHATVRLMDHIARRRGAARLMWLASFRLAEVVSSEHPLKTLRHELRLHRLCEEVVLESFSEQEVADFVADRLPRTQVPEAFVRQLHSHTDGLPLFVVNVIDDLNSQGALESTDGGVPRNLQVGNMQVPENLAGVIEKQIARLSSDQRALLEAASVCGVEFRPETVAEAMEHDAAWVSERCDHLARRQQWLRALEVERLPNGSLNARYGFRHALYRHVFYQRIGVLVRTQLHHRAAQSLETSRASGFTVTAAELAAHYEQSRDLMPALRHSAEAAENALRRFAPTEALQLAKHALEILPGCPAGNLRDAAALALHAMSGVATAQLRGVSSVETKRAFERAQAILNVVPQHSLSGMVLHGLGLVLLVRGEHAEARALGEQVSALAEDKGDRLLLLSACSVLGQVNALQGRLREAREWLERGIAACEEIGDESLGAAFVVDPGVTLYAARALPLLHLGSVDQGRASLEVATARAWRLGQPMAQMVAVWFGALFELRLGNADQVAQLADEMRIVVDDAALAQGYGPSRWYAGWAKAHLGDPLAGYQMIREAVEHNMELGMFCGAPEVLGYAAEALCLAGDYEAAQTRLDEAVALADKLQERIYLPQLQTLQARIALAQGEREIALHALRTALDEAGNHQDVWMEMMVLVALCELDDPSTEHLARLRNICGDLTEGIDTPLRKKAHALLQVAALIEH